MVVQSTHPHPLLSSLYPEQNKPSPVLPLLSPPPASGGSEAGAASVSPEIAFCRARCSPRSRRRASAPRPPTCSGRMVQSAEGPGTLAGLSRGTSCRTAIPGLPAWKPCRICGDFRGQVSTGIPQHEKIKNKKRPTRISPSSLTHFILFHFICFFSVLMVVAVAAWRGGASWACLSGSS